MKILRRYTAETMAVGTGWARRRVHRPDRTRAGARCDEEGAILILALIFILIVSLSIFGLVTFGGVGIKNTVNLKGQSSLEYAADGATEAAIQAVRYSYQSFSVPAWPPEDCLPDGAVLQEPGDTVTMTIDGDDMAVDCVATILPSGSTPRPQDRIIAFYACLQTGAGAPATCYSSNAVVSATIDFEDVSPAGIHECSATNTTTCGLGVAVVSWDVQTANN